MIIILLETGLDDWRGGRDPLRKTPECGSCSLTTRLAHVSALPEPGDLIDEAEASSLPKRDGRSDNGPHPEQTGHRPGSVDRDLL